MWRLACLLGVLFSAASCNARREGSLTIRFTPTAECKGGELLFDGVVLGAYPMTRRPVPAGDHQIELRSEGDCAGFVRRAVTIERGSELVLDIDQLIDSH